MVVEKAARKAPTKKAKRREPRSRDEITITLTISEIAVIAQRSLAEKLSGTVGGTWSGLWNRIEKEIERK